MLSLEIGRTGEVSAIIKDLYKLTENPLPPFLTHTLEEVKDIIFFTYTRIIIIIC